MKVIHKDTKISKQIRHLKVGDTFRIATGGDTNIYQFVESAPFVAFSPSKQYCCNIENGHICTIDGSTLVFVVKGAFHEE